MDPENTPYFVLINHGDHLEILQTWKRGESLLDLGKVVFFSPFLDIVKQEKRDLEKILRTDLTPPEESV